MTARFDKSKDYLLQVSVKTAWYLRKTAEGSATFNTSSVATFQAAAKQVEYAVKQTLDRTSDGFQQETVKVYLWRTPWLAAGLTDLPCIGDKLLVDGQFFLVEQVDYTDMDDSGDYQRYALTCLGSKRTPTA